MTEATRLAEIQARLEAAETLLIQAGLYLDGKAPILTQRIRDYFDSRIRELEAAPKEVDPPPLPCPKCGQEMLSDGWIHCPRCGERLK